MQLNSIAGKTAPDRSLERRLSRSLSESLTQDDLLLTDPEGNEYPLLDGYDSSRDITTVYAREGKPEDSFSFKVGLADLQEDAPCGHLDLYLMLDFEQGGNFLLPDGIRGLTDHPWEVAVAAYDPEHWNIYTQSGVRNEALQALAFDPGEKAVTLSLDKSLLREMGWRDGQAINLQVFTTSDQTGTITDATTSPKPWENSGFLIGAVSTKKTDLRGTSQRQGPDVLHLGSSS